MSEVPHQQDQVWEHYLNRTTERGLILVLGKSVVNGQFEMVAIDENGAREPLSGDNIATNAYFHPNLTPGLEDNYVVDPWDDALDAYNNLSEEDQKAAMEKFTRFVESGAVAPVILLDSIKRAVKPKELRKAA